MPALTSELYDKTLTFETYSPSILGAIIKNAKFLSHLDPQSAAANGLDLNIHNQVYPDIKENGVPDNPNAYKYAKFQTANGILVLGVPWIKQSSIQIVETTTIIVTCPGYGAQDVERMRATLIRNSFENFTIEVKS